MTYIPPAPDTRRVSPAAAALITHAEAHGASAEQLENLVRKYALPEADTSDILAANQRANAIIAQQADEMAGLQRRIDALEAERAALPRRLATALWETSALRHGLFTPPRFAATCEEVIARALASP